MRIDGIHATEYSFHHFLLNRIEITISIAWIRDALASFAAKTFYPVMTVPGLMSFSVTSGITGVFPKGIVIGKVEDVQEQQGNMEKLVSIDPSVDIEKVDKVLIIK